MTHLRKIMLEELQRRNYAPSTVGYYVRAVEGFAKHFGKAPDQLNREHLREYQAYLLRERKLEPRTVKLHVSALRFFFVKTLKRSYLLGRHPLSQSAEAAADHPHGGRSRPADRFCSQPHGSHPADGALFHGHAQSRTAGPAGQRYRQPIDVDPHSARQRRSRPLRSAQPEVAGDLARVLALDETEDLAISRHGRRLACG